MPGSHLGERTSDLFRSLSGSPRQQTQTQTQQQNRRKSIWKTDTRVAKLRGSHAAPHSTAGGAMAAHSSHHRPNHRSRSPFRETKKKKENSLLDVLFPKRKNDKAGALSAPSKPLLLRTQTAPTAASIARGVEILHSIFPKWDAEPLQALLECNEYIMEEAIAAILRIEAVDETARNDTKAAAAAAATASEADRVMRFPVKHPLPDDFLRLPDDDSECSDKDDGDNAIKRKAARLNASDDDDDDDECDDDDGVDQEHKRRVDDIDDIDTRSEQSSTLAEDDGTLYGKEFTVDSDDDSIRDSDSLPLPPLRSGAATAKLVKDSMDQKFIPEELRTDVSASSVASVASSAVGLAPPTYTLAATTNGPPSSIFATAHIDVIKRSKLNLTEAENRIRHREPHLVFELLSKASEIYRNGVISSHELDALRAMIVQRIQPSKMLMDTTLSMDGIISDHEWHLLILKAKGIRQGLSIRVINEDFRAVRSNSHMEYMIRVVDVESGVVWFTRKRFREFYKLYRKLGRLSGRVNACEFPTRRSGRNSATSLASDRAPILETFLRTTAALVTPSPLTFLHGVALKQLQTFLDVPHPGLLERNRTQAIPRELRVFVYHTVLDVTSPEGKACAKFIAKIKANGVDVGKSLLEEMGDILDSVHEYMLEHRYDEMQTHVQRLLVYFGSATGSVGSATSNALPTGQTSIGGRSSSFVSITSVDDVLNNNDKVQSLISDAIRHELEERVCVPLMLDLTMYLRHKVEHKERQFRQRVLELQGKPQSYFGIPIDKISLSSWRSVVDVIKEIDDAFLPLDKMRKLVATAHAIHTLYRAERQRYRASLAAPTPSTQRRHSRRHSISYATVAPPPASAPSRVLTGAAAAGHDTIAEQQRLREQREEREALVRERDSDDALAAAAAAEAEARAEQEDVLSGDDFLPIFIYVIVHSDLRAPIMTQVLLNRLCDPEKRRSESGYYLATFEAALHHIMSRDVFDAEQS